MEQERRRARNLLSQIYDRLNFLADRKISASMRMSLLIFGVRDDLICALRLSFSVLCRIEQLTVNMDHILIDIFTTERSLVAASSIAVSFNISLLPQKDWLFVRTRREVGGVISPEALPSTSSMVESR